jgi:hypothetical protein
MKLKNQSLREKKNKWENNKNRQTINTIRNAKQKNVLK